MGTVNITVRVDEQVKRDADDLFADLGLTLSGAINVFLKQSLRQQAIPFQVSRNVPNAKTTKAIEEARHAEENPDRKTYRSCRDFRKEMDDDE
ncbi:MAG: type II toxin-antitoxin system RelB/DinJ family antitoxin [Lachnospiraceae bacterium]|nr:type II toxin-antitoxin system RelB/DinJ family antitoxin [Lachnospiraceae bacterium]